MIQEVLAIGIRQLNTWKIEHKDYKIISCNRINSSVYSVIFEDGQKNRDALSECMEYLCMPERQAKPFENISPEVNVMLYDGIIYRGHYDYDKLQWVVRTKDGVQCLADDEVASWHYLREEI